MNIVLSVLYSEGYWIESSMALRLGRLMREFLGIYQQCAAISLAENLNRYAMVPKCHMISHAAEELVDDGGRAPWVTNPLATSNQVQEDFIGRPSRLSRRVHPGRIHTRVLERSLLACFQVL